ncbi:Pancreatic lipase- protein 2 [Bulinus truncatus]|nr:Pancreatic lipase- protein 2 [Bulinus truncatus]
MSLYYFFALTLFLKSVEVNCLQLNDTEIEEESTCYGSLGCFTTDGPFASSLLRPLSLKPQSPVQLRTVFKLYTREIINEPQDLQAIHTENVSTIFSHFKQRKTKIIVHGFMDNPALTNWQKRLKDEFLIQGDYNVIIVDWSKGNLPPYSLAVANSRVVGAQIAELINELTEAKNVTPGDFHLIGHSLGAQVCGYAGERISGLGRITGLDPAGPYFDYTDPVVRLDPTDAAFVDVIHTDIEADMAIAMGMKQPAGHLDFYPNLGRDQPGCSRDPWSKIIEWGLVQGVEEIIACNHLRAVHFFIESVNSQCPFIGYACESEEEFTSGRCNTCLSIGCASMGLHADKNKPPTGEAWKIFLTTGDRRPFCQYHLDVTVKFSAADRINRGQFFVVFHGDDRSTEEIRLNQSPMDIKAGDVYTFKVGTSKAIGTLRAMTILFYHYSPVVNDDNDTQQTETPKLYLQEVEVHVKETGAKTRFCANVRLEDGESVSISKIC